MLFCHQNAAKAGHAFLRHSDTVPKIIGFGPVEAFLAFFFPATEIQAFKEHVSLKETAIKCLHT